MDRKVTFTNTAKKGIQLISIYLEDNWSKKVKSEFIAKFEKSIKRILKFPNSNVFSKVLGVHKCHITKHTSFYYKITDSDLVIIAMIDNRMLKNKGIVK